VLTLAQTNKGRVDPEKDLLAELDDRSRDEIRNVGVIRHQLSLDNSIKPRATNLLGQNLPADRTVAQVLWRKSNRTIVVEFDQ
jgi:hypothetical protein